jgi:TonB family protein
MRDDLHRMEMADRYLDGAMSADERSAFEAQAATDPELRQVIDEQRALREGMQRLHLRAALSAAHRSWVLKQWMPRIIGLIVVGGLITAGMWYVSEQRHGFEEEEIPIAPLMPDTIATDPAPAAPVERQVIHRDVVDTVIYLIKDGKRIRVDSIPKGAKIIGTEMHRKPITDTASQELNELAPGTIPAVEHVEDAVTSTEPELRSGTSMAPMTEKHDLSVNFLTSEKPPTHLGQATEMQILRPKNSESQPEYPGGFDAMYLFLKKNLRVPENLKMGGTVVVSFVVDEKGAIKEAEVEQGLNKACDAEAIRVVRSMPKWIPCMAEGKPVRSRIEVPLTFSPVKVKNGSSDSELVPVQEQPVKIPRQLRNGGG